MLRKIALTLTLLGLVTALDGCGNKGDLYLPDESAETFYLADSATQK